MSFWSSCSVFLLQVTWNKFFKIFTFVSTQEKILDSQIWEFQFTYLEIFTLCLFCNFQFGILRGLGYCNSQLGFEFKLNQTCLGKTKITMWKTYLTNLKLKQSTRFGIMSFPSLWYYLDFVIKSKIWYWKSQNYISLGFAFSQACDFGFNFI